MLSQLPPSWVQRIIIDGDYWIWTGADDGHGYGLIRRVDREGRRRSEAAHRAVWSLLIGPIPDGHDLHHQCLRKACVKPAHLSPMPHAAHAAHHVDETCNRGHSLIDAYWTTRDGRPWRMCRPCQIERQRRYKAARRAAA